MGSEVSQLAIMLLGFAVVFVSWLFIIYLPGRTMEGQWEGDKAERLDEEARRAAEAKEPKTTMTA